MQDLWMGWQEVTLTPNRRKPEHLRQGLTFFFPSLCDIALEITARFLDMSGQVQNK